MKLIAACELLEAAHTQGNAVDFWRAVGYVCQALAQLRLPPTREPRLLVEQSYEDEWRLWDREHFILGMSRSELLDLAEQTLRALISSDKPMEDTDESEHRL